MKKQTKNNIKKKRKYKRSQKRKYKRSQKRKYKRSQKRKYKMKGSGKKDDITGKKYDISRLTPSQVLDFDENTTMYEAKPLNVSEYFINLCK